MSLLLSMSLAGSLPLALHFLMKIGRRGNPGPLWDRRLLKLSMFFFLCPFQCIKYILPVKFPNFFYWRWKMEEKFYLSREGYSVATNEFGEYVLRWDGYRVIETVWVSAVILFVLWQMTKYWTLRRRMIRTSAADQEADFYEGLARDRAPGRWRHVHVVRNSYIRTPFTVGVWNHWIVLPDWEFDREEMTMICIHEAAHIRSRDILYKMVCMGILLLHWFNPMAWLLIREYGITAEKYCDGEVVKTLETERERKKYARLLVDLAVTEPSIPAVFQDHLSRGKKQMKRRIDAILNRRTGKKVFCPLSFAAAFLLSSLTVLAYQVKPSATLEQFEEASSYQEAYSVEGWDPFVAEITELPFHGAQALFVEDGTGKIYRYYDEENKEERGECIHTYITGKYSDHLINSTGGCKVIQYRAKRCSKCGDQIILEEISSTTYKVCPHG